MAWQSWWRSTRTCADAAGSPEVISQMCRSWTSTTCGRPTRAAPTAPGSIPTGAASRKIRPDCRIRPAPARTMRAATIRVAIGSARSKPVASTTAAATTVAANAYRSVRIWANAPSALRLRRCPGRRFARYSSQVAARLTATPVTATASISPPVTGWGAIRRRTAS